MALGRRRMQVSDRLTSREWPAMGHRKSAANNAFQAVDKAIRDQSRCRSAPEPGATHLHIRRLPESVSRRQTVQADAYRAQQSFARETRISTSRPESRKSPVAMVDPKSQSPHRSSMSASSESKGEADDRHRIRQRRLPPSIRRAKHKKAFRLAGSGSRQQLGENGTPSQHRTNAPMP
jgi:hypothetical protein